MDNITFEQLPQAVSMLIEKSRTACGQGGESAGQYRAETGKAVAHFGRCGDLA